MTDLSLLDIQNKIKLELYCHQKSSLKIMLEMEQGNHQINSNIGILADPPGSGKSLVILSLIAKDGSIYSHWTPNTNGIDLKPQYLNTNVIIAPKNIIHQWVEYIGTQTTLSYKIIASINGVIDGEVDINLISSEMSYSFFETPNYVRRIVIDELDSSNIKIISNKIKARCQYIWLVTATPQRLLTREPDIYSYFSRKGEYNGGLNSRKLQIFFDTLTFPRCMFANILLTHFNQILIRNNENDIKASMKVPAPVFHKIICRSSNLQKILGKIDDGCGGIVSIHQCLDAHNYRGVAKILKCQIRQPVDIVVAITTKYRETIDELTKRINILERTDSNSFELLAPMCTTQNEGENSTLIDKDADDSRIKKLNFLNRELDSVKTRLEAIETKFKQMSSEVCGICYEHLGGEDPVMLMDCCKNFLCMECSIDYRASKLAICPYCRGKLKMTLLSNTDYKTTNKSKRKTNEGGTEIVELNKIEWLIEEINSRPNDKFLVFSNYDDTFRQISKKMEKHCISYLILDDKDIVDNVEKFNNIFDGINVMLMNSIRYGAGLNLQKSTDIVIFHKLNEFLDEQVIGRAQRIGRTEPLHVHHLEYGDNSSNKGGI